MVTHSLDWVRWRDLTTARTWLERIRTQGESTWDYARRHPRRATELLILAPFWLGAEAPPPAVLGRPQRAVDPGFIDPAGVHVHVRSKAIARRIGFGWFAGSILRGVALGLLVLSIWVVLSLIGIFTLPSIPIATGLIGFGGVLGSMYGWLIWPSPVLVAEMLDRTFHLRERLVTAFDRAQDDSRVARLQRADAANAVARAERRIARTHYLPIREAAIFLIALGTLLALLMTWVPQTAIGAVDTNAVPQFVPASERLAEPEAALPDQESQAASETESAAVSISDIQEKGQASETARSGLERVGEALQSNATTKPAGDSLVNGDYGTGSDQLRESAAAVGAMSQEERDALADEFDRAADELEATNPELAEQLRETADAVRKGGPEAEQAINDLADTVDDTASTVDDGEAPAASDVDQGSSSSESESSQQRGEGEEGQESEQGQSQGEEPAESGQGSDPGEGSDAQSGVSENPQEGEQSGEEPSEGSDQGGQGGTGSEGEQSEGASDQESSQEGEGTGTESDQSSDSQGDNTSDAESDESNSGSNGDGQSQSSSDSSSDEAGQAPDDAQAPTEESSEANQGEANENPPEGGDGSNDGGTGTESQGGSSLELEGDSEDSVQSGGDSGTSSLGSGSDSTSGNGTGTEANEGIAGPDSNRVPESLRDIVRDYFETEP